VQCAGGRLDGGRQRGRASEGERRRDRRVERQHRQLGLGRPLGGQAEHAIADRHVRHALAELVDDARRLVAHGLRELRIHQALALLPVARVDAGRAYRDPDLARTRMRIGEIHDLEDLRAPEPAETDCLHHSLRSRLSGGAYDSLPVPGNLAVTGDSGASGWSTYTRRLFRAVAGAAARGRSTPDTYREIVMPRNEISGATAIVTGASRGFGRGIAAALTKAGARVTGVARDGGQLAEVRAELGESFTPVTGDAADPALAGQLIDAYRPDLLVLNAGATPP